MLATSLGAAILVAQSAFGGLWHHGRKAGCCGDCGADSAYVAAQVMRLQSCPRWRDRDDAAKRLRKVGWECHPGVVEALTCALLRDCEEEVREEAARSLAKLAPCVPLAHAALRRAADCDPDWATRHWARKGLKALGKRCDGACDVCGPAGPGVDGPLPGGEPGLVLPVAPTELRIEGPAPADLPPIVPGSSPFAPSGLAPRPPVGSYSGVNYAPLLLSEPAPAIPSYPDPPPPPPY